MTKITLNDLANLQNENTAVTKINQNNHTLVQALDNTLSRDGTTPNQMQSELDMNNHDIINVKEITIEDGMTWAQLPTSPRKGDMIYRGDDKWETLAIGPAGSFLGCVGGDTPEWNYAAGLGDMNKAAYDPNNFNVDVYGQGLKILTALSIPSSTFPAGVQYLQTQGYRTKGDLGAALYVKVNTPPSHAGKFQSADGAWWELRERSPNQYMFGAVGSAITDDFTTMVDDTVAIQNLLDYGKYFKTFTNTGINIQADKGIHKVTNTLVVMCGCDLSAMMLLSDASVLSKTMRIGGNTGYSDLIYQHIVVRTPVIVNVAKVYPQNFGIKGTGWTGFQTSVGLEIANVQDAHIYVSHIAGYGRNLWMSAYNQGNAYNQIFLAQLGNGFYNLALEPADPTAWVNENTFYGGHLYHESGEGTGVVGVREIYIDGTNDDIGGIPNNNIFIKPSVEGNVPDYQVQIRGAYNRIIQARWESAIPKVYFYAASSGESFRNVIDGGYNCENIQFVNTAEAAENTLICPTLQKISGSPTALVVNSTIGDTLDQPHIVGFDSTFNPLSLSATNPSWSYRLYTRGLQGKRTNDDYARVFLDYQNGKILFGGGASAPVEGFQDFGGSVGVTTHFLPLTDGAYKLGDTGFRWDTVYAVNGSISTSDAREKVWRGSLNEAELKVAKKLSKLVGIYQWASSLKDKGDSARLHAGITAQSVEEAFKSEGLDGFKYGILCYDEWEENDVRSSGNRYGIRYDELWAFVTAGFEQRLQELEK